MVNMSFCECICTPFEVANIEMHTNILMYSLYKQSDRGRVGSVVVVAFFYLSEYLLLSQNFQINLRHEIKNIACC